MRGTIVAIALLALVIQANCRPQFWDSFKQSIKDAGNFVKGAAQGTRDMYNAYSDMRDANYIGADKYFHARGNHDAAKHGPGGVFAAGVISDARERIQGLFGSHAEDSAADQAANKWGRGGGDPNIFRPEGLPEKYRK